MATEQRVKEARSDGIFLRRGGESSIAVGEREPESRKSRTGQSSGGMEKKAKKRR
jgi:hypothetical protein